MNRRHACMFLPVVAVAMGSAAQAPGQTGNASLIWQTSVDGVNWSGGLRQVEPGHSVIRVRLIVDWSQDAGYALAMARFDGTISNTSEADSVVEAARLAPFATISQSIVATRFGSVIKIDDARDTFPPGGDVASVIASQTAEFVGLPFSREKPAPVLAYSLQLDSSVGERVISAIDVFPRIVGVYTTANGEINFPQSVNFIPATIRVIPAPNFAAIMGAVLLFASVRRRRS